MIDMEPASLRQYYPRKVTDIMDFEDPDRWVVSDKPTCLQKAVGIAVSYQSPTARSLSGSSIEHRASRELVRKKSSVPVWLNGRGDRQTRVHDRDPLCLRGLDGLDITFRRAPDQPAINGGLAPGETEFPVSRPAIEIAIGLQGTADPLQGDAIPACPELYSGGERGHGAGLEELAQSACDSKVRDRRWRKVGTATILGGC
ncbi:hypothetical protein N7532_002647 [Penicillium argentinense]|uniref:Uncharacterized protein n=1 Tax=Penicillium argentinense TaxID=1131581 RepID=A0A9W9G2D2_9EURO|nr:uncharacterized protein N7532_002647 [Penicillium argentinense]KAJ5110002.1 hypothetical protein N7532_002647 [Penicillium argentinense]